MKWLFLILSFGSAIMGFFVLKSALSSIHEITALVLFLIASVLFAAYGIVASIEELSNRLERTGLNKKHLEDKRKKIEPN